VDEGRADAGSHVADDLAGGAAHGEVVGAVDRAHLEPGEAAHQFVDRRGRLLLRRYRDGVTVVGHDEQHREVLGAGGVEALPELALGRGPLAQADVGDLVALGRQAELGVAHDVPAGLGAAHGGQALAARGARLSDDVALAVAPVGRHLAAARGGVVGRPDGLQQDLLGRDAEAEHQRQVAVVGKEPVVAGAQLVGEPEQERLVPRTRDLEEHPALLLQGDLTVVDRPRHAGEQQVAAQLLGRVGRHALRGPRDRPRPHSAGARVVPCSVEVAEGRGRGDGPVRSNGGRVAGGACPPGILRTLRPLGLLGTIGPLGLLGLRRAGRLLRLLLAAAGHLALRAGRGLLLAWLLARLLARRA
jgi:hypothetical protein